MDWASRWKSTNSIWLLDSIVLFNKICLTIPWFVDERVSYLRLPGDVLLTLRTFDFFKAVVYIRLVACFRQCATLTQLFLWTIFSLNPNMSDIDTFLANQRKMNLSSNSFIKISSKDYSNLHFDSIAFLILLTFLLQILTSIFCHLDICIQSDNKSKSQFLTAPYFTGKVGLWDLSRLSPKSTMFIKVAILNLLTLPTWQNILILRSICIAWSTKCSKYESDPIANVGRIAEIRIFGKIPSLTNIYRSPDMPRPGGPRIRYLHSGHSRPMPALHQGF